MRRILILAFLTTGCAQEPPREEKAQVTLSAPASGASSAKDYTYLDQYAGQVVTLTGTFQHDKAIHGIVVLESGLRIYIPHFDLLARGDDWLKYVGHRCAATGIIHTWTKDIPGYNGATLQINDFGNFTGSTGE